MQRLIRLSFLILLLGLLTFGETMAQPKVFVSGKIDPGHVRIFTKDSLYIFNREYQVHGTLIIEPGTDVKFNPDGRLVVHRGGRVIADGDAVADYIANPRTPNGQYNLDPIGTPGGVTNPDRLSGYADMRYFLYNTGAYKTVNVRTTPEQTVNASKYDYIFNVMLDKANRRIVDLEYPGVPGYPSDNNFVKIPFEMALMFQAARLEIDPNFDNNLNTRAWIRLNSKTVNIEKKTIRFIGQPVNDFSREWGHILILPGARGAFFRNCTFDGFRKDTTVDRTDHYSTALLPDLTPQQVASLNRAMNQLTNGGGGAMTTFSSRTWLLNCEFMNNMARFRGGALQILQAPEGFPQYVDEGDGYGLDYYDFDKNPNITNPDGTPSQVSLGNRIPKIDEIDESGYVEPVSDYYRQGMDDGRLSLYLGRMRNLKFSQNYVRLSNVKFTQTGTINKVEDNLDVPADYPMPIANHAFGGAVYIAGAMVPDYREMEVGFGINQSLKMGGNIVKFTTPDEFECIGNSANNYQGAASTEGARGGAIYIGDYTSLIVAGKFHSNETYTKYLQDQNDGVNSGYYSMGGAIYAKNTFSRLQVRGGPDREDTQNQTDFYQNSAGAGGAIFVDGNVDYSKMSPVIGGSDTKVETRDYGFNVRFRENKAMTWGGAIYSKRNMSINGAGGVVANKMIGYGEKYRIAIENNTAGLAGGGLYVNIPNANPPLPAEQRIIRVVRASFYRNMVGENITGDNRQEVRGGGAIYSLNGDLNLVKGVEFRENKVKNGNGGAIALVHPITSAKRYFLTDLDQEMYDEGGVVYDYTSTDGAFRFENVGYDADGRMLTRFLDNEAYAEADVLASNYGSGSGTTQVGKGTLGTTSALYGTTWLDNNIGYAVGYNGVIIKYTQAGNRWEYQKSGTNFRLNDIYFVSAQMGFAAGNYGIILRTTDGGRNWEQLNSPTDQHINSIKFVGTNLGFAVCNNGYILRTNDGGDTWTSSRPQTANLNSIFFTNNQTGYVAGDRGLILKTTDGGANWTVLIGNTLVNLNHVIFVDVNNGYIAGNAGTLLKTTNAGSTWIKIDVGTSNDLMSGYFTSVSTGYVVGTFGTALKTVDGGNNWTTMTVNTTNHLYDAFFPSSNNGYIVGNFGLLLGTTDAGANWKAVRPADESLVDVKRLHQEIKLPENGVGLGGAIYVLDSVTVNRLGRIDSVKFNRVRMENNTAYSGAAIYSDNYDMKLIFNRSLIAGNTATSEIGKDQNVITGPVVRDSLDKTRITFNKASHDLVGAIIYGEIQGPLPSNIYSEAANSIYDNHARFLFRLPDAPNTKGVLAGTTGIGYGGTDTLRGNYWGRTEADVNMVIDQSNSGFDNAEFETFFVGSDGKTHLKFLFSTTQTDDPRFQGPFETFGLRDATGAEEILRYQYRPVPLRNKDFNDENTPADNSIPEKVLMSGHIYDIYDKGTDIKTADYSQRRMSPIEDFAVGIPPLVKRFAAPGMPSDGKYIKRWTRDPFIADSIDPQSGTWAYPIIHELQDEFRPDVDGNLYHPIGYPLYLEAKVDYAVGNDERTNHDPRVKNESVFFVINQTTLDYIRVNLKQVSEVAPDLETFRARVELVPDLTRRNPNTLIRRTAQGLYNLGAGNILLEHLGDNPYKEDRAALPGRRYHGSRFAMGSVSDLYYNRDQNGQPSWPVDNNGTATHYAGERYCALPVNVGDDISVISRTVLWREGAIPAFTDGIEFKVVRSTEPPVYTGNVVQLENNIIRKTVPSENPYSENDTEEVEMTEFANTIFLTEDRYYPQPAGWFSEPLDPNLGKADVGRDSILTITAIDSNRFYDPRSLQTPEDYPYLTYTWDVDLNSGLKRWLYVDTVRAEDNKWGNQIPFYEAMGYLKFTGKPINPYVVPGGETVRVTAANYPPHFRTIDSLKKANFPQDVIDKFITIFPPYMHAALYDDVNARYAQQDTINIGANYKSREYQFRIFVVDSAPKFLEPGSDKEEVYKQLDWEGNQELYVVYEPSVYTCGPDNDGKLVANLTDKLRFKADFNTDDELEDKWAKDWDFRYGKTAYGFMNIAIRPNDDTTVVDTTIYNKDGEGDNMANDTAITQSRPVWMANQYLHEYGDGTNDPQADPFGIYFTSYGQLDIRIPADEAMQLLKPDPQYNDALNLDTVATVVVNDGHGGLNFKPIQIYINVAPKIITETLPPAKEDFDYNPQLLDSARMIKVFDPNFDQKHTFELIYANESRNEIPKDPCFPEAGSWDLTGLKTTPRWLKVNEESGLLYGTPRIKDAPRDEQVTVVVTDEGGLTHLKTFSLRVDSTNHKPNIAAAPINRCIDKNGKYFDTVWVCDLDLLREPVDKTETLTITVKDADDNDLSGKIKVDKPTFSGIQDTSCFPLVISAVNDKFDLRPDPDGKVTIKIIVDDGEEKYTLIYRLKMSDPTDFVCPITVQNNIGGLQVVNFGTAPLNATTGDEVATLGKLDSNFCEFDLPPLPPTDIFDVRWNIPTRNGILRSIFPRATQGLEGTYIYRGEIQAGGVNGNTSPAYPVILTWNTDDIPAITDAVKNPTGGSWHIRDGHSEGNIFDYNMKYGNGQGMPYIEFAINGTTATLKILSNNVSKFNIVYDWTSPVFPIAGLPNEVKIVSVSPNPYQQGNAAIQFGLPKDNKISLDIIDPLGNIVASLSTDTFQAGYHTINWNGRDFNGYELPNGAYTCRLVAGGVTSAYPIVIVR